VSGVVIERVEEGSNWAHLPNHVRFSQRNHGFGAAAQGSQIGRTHISKDVFLEFLRQFLELLKSRRCLPPH